MSQIDLTKTSLGYGVGLRACHFTWLAQNILPEQTGVDWFEAITENILDHQGYARRLLFRLREHYPIVLHGVSMSIGSTDPINISYLTKLKKLEQELAPALVSDHLCWTGLQSVNSHDLLPMPLTNESLVHVTARIHQVQELLQRPLVLENPSTYMSFKQNEYQEWEFLSQLVASTGCQLLVDVNNIYVSSINHGFDAFEYLNGLPLSAVVQCHLAGATDMGEYLIDTHDKPVHSNVWQLYAALINACNRPISTLLEWDADIPAFPELVAELNLAKQVLKGSIPHRDPIVTATDALPISTPLAQQLTVTVPELPVEQ
ncbi:UPF0276 protein [Thalassotalea insulae]|uniref:UPF0276 protein n=1 Tax=Thalassotalea insulae TaxID=2056778 RepID=A0ABQ6GV23_9GAMM|nr:DUF692 domain-containing protein [Thalassotalea insulae]GLX79207.1 UPF0276 protein [Thalassotalea insulae]